MSSRGNGDKGHSNNPTASSRLEIPFLVFMERDKTKGVFNLRRGPYLLHRNLGSLLITLLQVPTTRGESKYREEDTIPKG